jgi:predicted transcriptional regulator
MAQTHTTVRITGEIEARVAELATRERRSRSQMVQILLEEALVARGEQVAA